MDRSCLSLKSSHVASTEGCDDFKEITQIERASEMYGTNYKEGADGVGEEFSVTFLAGVEESHGTLKFPLEVFLSQWDNLKQPE